ncbi:envelope stress response membrane protein PspC [Pacificimonas sp. ICDLI1SI03]|jgi:phage shock protein C|tara:strand:- start:90844 stop:91218 length:375 start_codon:yes stop_codon:yes gene_type:complete
MERRNRFYRNKAEGKWLGICAGLSDYTGVEPVWIRVGFLMSVWISGGLTLLAYIITAMVSDQRPADLRHEDVAERQFERQTRRSPHRSIRDVHSRFRALDRRLSDMERNVTTQNSSLSREIDAL